MLHSNDRIIRHKVGLLNLADELGNVAKACKMMGVSRDTFYRYKEAAEEGGVDALLEKNRRVPNPKNRVEPHVEEAVIQYAVAEPAHGQVRGSNVLRKRGVFVSPSGVRSIWLRHDLANFKQRLKALEAKVAEEGLILTESQVQALERKKQDDEACGEIDTAHPGYLGSQDTFYVGTFKGVGRVYQQKKVKTGRKGGKGGNRKPKKEQARGAGRGLAWWLFPPFFRSFPVLPARPGQRTEPGGRGGGGATFSCFG